MSAIEDLEPDSEPLDEAGSLLLQLVAAVDYLRRGIRPGFTVWDAFEEALRWQLNVDEDWTATDPLGRLIRMTLGSDDHKLIANALGSALRRWVQASAAMHNNGLTWEVSIARRVRSFRDESRVIT